MNSSESIFLDTKTNDLPYLLFTVGKNTYGISSEFVRSVETLGEITTITETDPNIRGGIIYQDNFIYLIDMRKLFGIVSKIEEFEKTVQPEQRMKDHENWITTLEKSVYDRTEFTLTDDPHQCAFGKWFYSFKTDNNVLRYQLNKIEAPHKAVHDSAKTIKEYMQSNEYELALSEIRKLRLTHYKKTMNLLSSLREIIAKNLKEWYIVIDTNDSNDFIKGLIVDTIVGVEYLDTTLQVPKQNTEYIKFIGRRKTNDMIVIVLNHLF